MTYNEMTTYIIHRLYGQDAVIKRLPKWAKKIAGKRKATWKDVINATRGDFREWTD